MEPNREILPPFFVPPMFQRMIVIGNDPLNESFDEQQEVKKPLQKEFLQKIETYLITNEDVSEKLSCAICQDIFNINEEVLKLPCNGAPHFFHKTKTLPC